MTKSQDYYVWLYSGLTDLLCSIDYVTQPTYLPISNFSTTHDTSAVISENGGLK